MIPVPAHGDCQLGLCRKVPVLPVTTTAIVPRETTTGNPLRPAADGAAEKLSRIRRGIRIAVESIKTVIGDRFLLLLSLLSGITLLFLVAAEGWNVTHWDFLFQQSTIWIPWGDSTVCVFDLRIFLIETICFFSLALVIAGTVIYRTEQHRQPSLPWISSGLASHVLPLARFSFLLAFAATLLFEIASQNFVISTILFRIDMAVFYLPYVYYVPDALYSAISFSSQMLVIDIALFLLALYIVPVMVMEKKGLISSLAGSIRHMRGTWAELLGCAIVLGGILLGMVTVALLIGQSPLLLHHDYDFFLQVSRGQVLMTVACYGFVLSLGLLTALGTVALGVAAADLCSGRKEKISGRHISSQSAGTAGSVR